MNHKTIKHWFESVPEERHMSGEFPEILDFLPISVANKMFNKTEGKDLGRRMLKRPVTMRPPKRNKMAIVATAGTDSTVG